MNGIPIITMKCPEGHNGEEVERSIRPLILTPDSLQRFYASASKYPRIFGEEFTGSFNKFINIFLSQTSSGELQGEGLFWVVDDFTGVFYLTDIYHPYDALMHFAFFDKRLRGRDLLTRAMIRYVFEKYGFNRLSAEVPLYAGDHTFAFIEKGVRLKKEGRRRKAAEYKGDMFDVNLYGILREESLNHG